MKLILSIVLSFLGNIPQANCECTYWPSSKNICSDDGEEPIVLDASVRPSDFQKCENLCRIEGGEGCCFLTDSNGCKWKKGSVATEDSKGKHEYFAITCSFSDHTHDYFKLEKNSTCPDFLMETITEFRDCQYAAARFQEKVNFRVNKSYYPFGCNFEQVIWNKKIIFNIRLNGKRSPNIKPICRKGNNCTHDSACLDNEFCYFHDGRNDGFCIANPCYNKCRNPVHGIKTNCTITGDFPFTGKCHCPAGFEGENCEIHYVQSPSKWCHPTKIEPNLQYIRNIRQAKDACSNDYGCAMIADVASLGEQFSFCDAKSKVRHSLTSSSLYTKCLYNQVESGRHCYFPFEYNGELHYNCIYDDKRENEGPWCSSTPKFSDHSFGHCSCAHSGILDSEEMDLQQDIKLNSTSGNQETIGDDVSNDKGQWKWTVILVLVFILISFILISTTLMLFQRSKGTTFTWIFARVLKLSFKLICVLLAIFYSTVQAERYFRNEDTSLISFRSFNAKPNDKYPEITFCLGNGAQFKDIVTEFQTSRANFSSILKGNKTFASLAPETFKKITRMHPHSYFTEIDEIIRSYSFKGSKTSFSFDKTTTNNRRNQRIINTILQATHRDPDQICFTRNRRLIPTLKEFRKETMMGIDLKILGVGTRLKIFVHYPGQFIRTTERPVVDIIVGELSEKITLTISDVTTLRKRSTPTNPCNRSKIDEGYIFRSKIVDIMKCKPMYWDSLSEPKASLQVCETADQLKKLYEMNVNITGIISKSPEPCDVMRIPVDTQRTGISFESNMLYLSALYLTTEYQEIVNIRDFDLNSMFAGIGGFVGMFLGYSLLQLVDLLAMPRVIKRFHHYLPGALTFLQLSLSSQRKVKPNSVKLEVQTYEKQNRAKNSYVPNDANIQEEHIRDETSKVLTEVEVMKSAIRKNEENTVKGLEEIERIKLILIENQILNIT